MFQGRPPARHPRAELPDDGHAQTSVPAVLPDIQRLVTVVFTDRQRQVGEQVDGKPRLIAQGIGDVLLRRRTEDVDVELEHRVAETAGRLVERPASRGNIARDAPHGEEDRRHGRAIGQGKSMHIARQGHVGGEVCFGAHGMSGIERIGVATDRLVDERHGIGTILPDLRTGCSISINSVAIQPLQAGSATHRFC